MRGARAHLCVRGKGQVVGFYLRLVGGLVSGREREKGEGERRPLKTGGGGRHRRPLPASTAHPPERRRRRPLPLVLLPLNPRPGQRATFSSPSFSTPTSLYYPRCRSVCVRETTPLSFGTRPRSHIHPPPAAAAAPTGSSSHGLVQGVCGDRPRVPDQPRQGVWQAGGHRRRGGPEPGTEQSAHSRAGREETQTQKRERENGEPPKSRPPAAFSRPRAAGRRALGTVHQSAPHALLAR